MDLVDGESEGKSEGEGKGEGEGKSEGEGAGAGESEREREVADGPDLGLALQGVQEDASICQGGAASRTCGS